ncbi:MAG: EpsI family protein [Candidatus Omnitrophica bacterium CG11_big_fil_rev_8_21_14_0_20_42_13]|uniref:EpsI family protein n=1 Tax=Candidatus Ghiorseimicrobium undicola TaxID=1974746 RepID=A0A2H0LYK5_9BACT|nr:MAG: EpsI family protein [Candidatus Omnitrophica bacterium CG11_big_fil_rev_8_21_14_0_20_42_13]
MKRYILIIVLFAIAAGLSIYLYYQQIKPEDAFDVSSFPMQIADWQGEDIPLEEMVYEILETRNILMREYKRKGEPGIVVYIVYSDKNRKSSHPPEICLAGGGIDITTKKSQEIAIADNKKISKLKVNYLIAEKGNARELMLYWFKGGNTFTANYLKQQFKIMLRQLQGKPSGGAMIRISTPITNGEEEALIRLTSFANKITPLIIKKIP